MKLGIMQPYFLPYIGYFQLINAVDKFVLYDNIKYTKKGWFNRNRILVNGSDKMFTIPIKRDSDYLNVCERYLSDEYNKQNNKILRLIENSYSKAKYFNDVYPLIERIVNYDDVNLFNYIHNSIVLINFYLEIDTEIIISSKVPIDHSLFRGENKVLELCKKIGADEYINAIGGIDLYNKEVFKNNNISLEFIKSNIIEYKQFKNTFIPWLSIIDILMFNSIEEIKLHLNSYQLV